MANTVKLTIDGRPIEAAAGTLVIEAARHNGIEIPAFCYYEGLALQAACRMCLVEVEKAPKLMTACTLPVAEGMVVRTDTPKVAEARKSTLEFLLTNHPLDCPVCDKGGECELQDMVFRYGAGESRFVERKQHVDERQWSPVVFYDKPRCILCFRCVRICGEGMGVGALGIINRGAASEIAPNHGDRLECDECGMCIDICPVGALTSGAYRYHTRPCQPLQVLVLFVGGVVRADDAKLPSARPHLTEPRRDGLDRTGPGNRLELARSVLHQRRKQPFRMLGEISGVAALQAQELAVDAGAVAVVGPLDDVVPNAQRGLAAVGAVRADGSHVLHLPGPGLVAVGSAGERANGADVDTHAALVALEPVAVVGRNLRRSSAIDDTERAHSHPLAANADAAEAEDAARLVVEHHRRPLPLVDMLLALDEPALARAIAEHHVL